MSVIHKYTSSKGEDFLSFDDWLRVTLMEDYHKFEAEITFPSPEYDRYYNDWLTAEQITSHAVIENGVELYNRSY